MKIADNELFTIAVVAYHQANRLYRAIDSVLNQNAENIEMIICISSAILISADDITQYIANNNTGNIKNFAIVFGKSDDTLVHMMNHALECATGRYVMFLNSEDILASEKTINTYYKNFVNADSATVALISQMAVFSRNMTQFEYYYLSPSIRVILESGDMNALLMEVIERFWSITLLHACYKREFLHSIGGFDGRYVVTEDIPTLITLLEANCKIKYCNFVSVRHSKNCSSNRSTYYDEDNSNNKIQDNLKMFNYFADKIRLMIQQEPLSKRWVHALKVQQYSLKQAEKQLAFKKGLKSKLFYAARHPAWILKRISFQIAPYVRKIATGSFIIAVLLLFLGYPMAEMLTIILPFIRFEYIVTIESLLAVIMMIVSALFLLSYLSIKFLKKIDETESHIVDYYG